MKTIYFLVFDNLGNGNDEFEIIAAYTHFIDANIEAFKLNNEYTGFTGNYDVVETTLIS